MLAARNLWKCLPALLLASKSMASALLPPNDFFIGDMEAFANPPYPDDPRRMKAREARVGSGEGVTAKKMRKPRFLQEPDPALAPVHSTCENAKDVQPDGPGTLNEVWLHDEDTSNIDPDVIDQKSVCFAASFGDLGLYYTFVGTGNPFYITTCHYGVGGPRNPDAIVKTGTLGLAADFNCSAYAYQDSDEVCVDTVYGYTGNCPDEELEGFAYVFLTEAGTKYIFAVDTEGPGKFMLRVGELEPVPEGEEENSCKAPEEIVPPSSLPEGEASSSVVLVRSTKGAFDEEFHDNFDEFSINEYTSGRWYAMDAPTDGAATVTVSTCSNDTTVHSTYMRIFVEKDTSVWPAPEFNCTTDYLIPFDGWSSSSSCEFAAAAGRDLATRDIATVPGERVYIYVASEYAFDVGDIAINITAEPITSTWEFLWDERDKRENRRVGVECTTDGDTVVCRDGCQYCDGIGALCYNRTDIVEFDDNYMPVRTAYALSMDGSSEEAFVYQEPVGNDLGECTATLFGQQCATCLRQDCGAPWVDCTNVAEAGTFWAIGVQDLCTVRTSVFSHEPRDHNVNGTCPDQYLSEIACNATAATLVNDYSLTCSCELDADDAKSTLKCTTECGVFCNEDQSVCGVRGVEDEFVATGDHTDMGRTFDYVAGLYEDGQTRWPLRITASPSTGYCSFSTLALSDFDISCGDCELAPSCGTEGGNVGGNGFLSPSSGATITCTSNEVDTPLDTCDANLQIDDGPLQFLSSNEFNECLDLTPPNAKCSEAVPLEMTTDAITGVISTGPIVGSNIYVPKSEGPLTDECLISGHHGVYYKVVGNGGLFQASTCFNETDYEADITIMGGATCDAETTDCSWDLDSPVVTCGNYAQTRQWQTEDGMEYLVFVGGFYAQGNYQLVVNEVELVDPMATCEESATTILDPNEYECECIPDQTFGGDDVAILSCLSTCERCGDEFCVEEGGHGFGLLYRNTPEPTRTLNQYNVTTDDGTILVGLDVSVVYCQAVVGDASNVTECDCELVDCEDGTTAASLNCSDYEAGLVLNFCEDNQPSSGNILSILSSSNEIGMPYGSCDGSPASAVGKQSEGNNEKPPANATTASDAEQVAEDDNTEAEADVPTVADNEEADDTPASEDVGEPSSPSSTNGTSSSSRTSGAFDPIAFVLFAAASLFIV